MEIAGIRKSIAQDVETNFTRELVIGKSLGGKFSTFSEDFQDISSELIVLLIVNCFAIYDKINHSRKSCAVAKEHFCNDFSPLVHARFVSGSCYVNFLMNILI